MPVISLTPPVQAQLSVGSPSDGKWLGWGAGEDLLDLPVIDVLLWHLCSLQRALCFQREGYSIKLYKGELCGLLLNESGLF